MNDSPQNVLSRRQMVSITGEIYLLRVTALGASLVSNVFLARLLGAAGKGMITAVTFWPTLLGNLLLGGLCTGIVAELGRSPRLFGPLARGLLWFALAATAAGIAGWQLVRLAGCVFSGDIWLVWCGVSLLLSHLVTTLFGALYTGRGEIAFANRMTTAGTVLFAIVMVALSLGHLADVGHALLVIVTIQTSVALFYVVCSRHAVSSCATEHVPWRPFLAFSAKAHGTFLGNLLFTHVVMILLTLLATPATLGIYSIAQICADISNALPLTLAGLLLPIISRLPHNEAARRMAQATRLANLAVIVLIALAATAATVLIPMVFGPDFTGSVRIVWMLTLSTWSFSAITLITCYYHGVNRMTPPITGAWLGVLVATGLGTLLIPSLGGLGAAAAVSVSRLGALLFLLACFRRDAGITARSLFLVRRQDLTAGWALLRQAWRRVAGPHSPVPHEL